VVSKGEFKMNLGFYVNKSNLEGKNSMIFGLLNDAVESKKVMDATVFYNDIDFNPMQTNFGMFNATELWAFTGTLVSDNIRNTVHAMNVINKFKLLHLFDRTDKDLMSLLSIADRVEFLVDSEEDQKEFYRVTKRKAKLINLQNIDQFLETIK
tara:strand:- start:1298 stop:1756 length:459 start_codon:yes stop_codon:yes gene_type:complete